MEWFFVCYALNEILKQGTKDYKQEEGYPPIALRGKE